MIDLKLDSSGDLALQSNDLVWVIEAERVRQQLQIKLNLWQGEWFLNTTFGTPYFTDILGKSITLNGAIAALKNSIYAVQDINSIENFNYTLNRHTRLLTVNFTVTTPYGSITYQGN